MIKLVPIADCHKNYDFEPMTPWPSQLPAYCYGDELICGFNRIEGFAVSLSEPSLPLSFKAIYPELSFQELARLDQKLSSKDLSLRKELWSLYGYRWKPNLIEVVEKMRQLPDHVQRWLQEKKLGPQDLAPLRSLTNIKDLQDFWPYLTCSTFSKSESSKAIELLTELLLLELDPQSLRPQTKDLTSWLKQLHQQRYPQTSSRDRQAENKIQSVAWPLKSEAKWVRRGDRAGIELKLFFGHPQELRRSLDRLQQLQEDLENSDEYRDLWSKN